MLEHVPYNSQLLFGQRSEAVCRLRCSNSIGFAVITTTDDTTIVRSYPARAPTSTSSMRSGSGSERLTRHRVRPTRSTFYRSMLMVGSYHFLVGLARQQL